MRQEHIEGRELTKWIAAATEAGDRNEVLASAQGYVQLLREHIAKEDTILFEMARQLLGYPDVEKLRKEFAEVERQIGPAVKAGCLAIADELDELSS